MALLMLTLVIAWPGAGNARTQRNASQANRENGAFAEWLFGDLLTGGGAVDEVNPENPD
jgi:hypothetical protein